MLQSKINQKPNLEKLYQLKSVSKTEKAYLDGLEQKLGQKIIRQVKFGNWLIDGLLSNQNIILEYDGPENHQSIEKQKKDYNRDQEFLKLGFSIYRLQWFEFEKDYQKYQNQLKKAIEFSSLDIQILINFIKKI